MKKYLSNEIDSQIKKEIPHLLPSKYLGVMTSISSQNSWSAIALITFLIFFFIPKINIEFLNILWLDNKNVNPTIEARTTNIVAIVSISFAIVGFLISNLSIKGGKAYNILFRRSYFFPITFFSLSLVGSFIILTAIKDHFNAEILSRILYFGILLIIIDIYLIGFLFTKLILFTNSKSIYKMACDDFVNEVKNRMYEYERETKSIKILNEIVNKSNPYLFPEKQRIISTMSKGKTIIKDINIKKLKKIINNKCDISIFHNNLYLGKNISYDSVLFSFDKYCSKINAEINSTIRYTNEINKSSSETREFVSSEVSKLIPNNDFRSIEQILNGYAEIIKIKNLNDSILEEFLNDITDFISKSIECNSLLSFQIIDKFIDDMLSLSIHEIHPNHYNRFLIIVQTYYNSTFTEKSFIINNTAKYSRALITERIRHSILKINDLIESEKDVSKIKSLSNLSYSGYSNLSTLLYNNISRDDLENFKIYYRNIYDMDMINNQFRNLESEFEITTDKKERDIIFNRQMTNFYYWCCMIGTKYWLYWQYYNNQITKDRLLKFMIEIDQRNIPRLWEMEYLYSKLNSIFAITYFDWWARESREQLEKDSSYSKYSALDWILFGYAVDLTLSNGFPISGDVDLSQFIDKREDNKKFLLTNILLNLEKVNNSIGKWKELFDNDEISVELITENVTLAIKGIDSAQMKKIAMSSIDPKKEEDFKRTMRELWEKETKDEFSNTLNLMPYISEEHRKHQNIIEEISTDLVIIDGKVYFIKDEVIKPNGGFAAMSSTIYGLKNKFNFNTINYIVNDNETIYINDNWDDLSKLLAEHYKEDSVIITSYNFARELISRFPEYKTKIINDTFLKNSTLIIADMKSGFSMRMHKDSDNNFVNIIIKMFTKDQAQTEYDKNVDYWSHNKRFERDDAISMMMNRVSIHYSIKWYIYKDATKFISVRMGQ